MALPVAGLVAALIVLRPHDASIQLRPDGVRLGRVWVPVHLLGAIELHPATEAAPYSLLRVDSDEGPLSLKLTDPGGERGRWMYRLLKAVGTTADGARAAKTPVPAAMVSLLQHAQPGPMRDHGSRVGHH